MFDEISWRVGPSAAPMLLIVEWVTTSLMLLHVSFAFVRYVDGHVIQRVPTRVFCHRPTGLQKDATRALSATPTTIIDKFEPPAPLPSYCKKVIDIGLPEGRCLGFSVEDLPVTHPDSLAWEQISNNKDHWIRSLLHPDEVSFGLKEVGSTDVPISSFWVGRLAMRAALGFPDYPVLRDSYGRPSLKESIRGSISHKQGIGVALVAPCSDTTPCGIGVDLEVTSRPGKRSIATKILTQNELDGLGRIPNVSVDEEVLLRFRYVIQKKSLLLL